MKGMSLFVRLTKRLKMYRVRPNRELVTCIAVAVKSAGATGVTSIGAGPGVLEWFLSEHFEPMAITAIDSDSCLIGPAKCTVLQGCAVQGQAVRVPSSNALLFCFGTRAPYNEYFSTYQGNLVIIIADITCTPYPGTREAAETFISGFELVCCTEGRPSQFGLVNGIQLYIYKRATADIA